jgi:cytoskeleton protein RodZ
VEAQTSDAPAGSGVAGGYRGVGASLRARRIELGLDLGEVADRLRIRRTYLAAIEDGRVDELPGPIYAVGFVRTYADYLGFQPVPAVERFKAELARAVKPTRLSFPTPSPESRAPRAWAIVIGLLLAGGVFAAWQYRQKFELPDLGIPAPPIADQTASAPTAEPPRAAPAATPAPASAATPAPTATPAPAAETPPPAPAAPTSPIAPGAPSRAVEVATLPPTPGTVEAPAAPATAPTPAPVPADAATQPTTTAAAPAATEGTRVVIRAVADSWVTISGTNNEVIVPGRILRPGDTLRIVNRPDATLWTGNLGGLEVSVDDKPIPRLGQSGESRRNVSLDPQRLLAGTAVTR